MGTTSEKLVYLNETKQRIKESINLTGANITDEPFRQYAVILKNRLPEIVGDPSIIWNNYEHVTGSGTSITISTYKSIFEYSLNGNTTQNGTPTPDAPVPVNTVTGNQTITISDGTNTTVQYINLNEIELCKIGTYKDRIYKSNGKWYLHKEVGKIVLNGSENWSYISVTQDILYRGKDIITNAKVYNDYSPYCNYFRGIPLNQQPNRQNGDIYINAISNIIDIIDNTHTTTTLFKNFLSDNKPVVYYVLATATDTKITDYDLLNDLNNLELMTGNVTITVSGDLPSPIDISAIKN